jgi:hypothetical protein
MMPRRRTVNRSGSLAGAALEKVMRNAACVVWTNAQSDRLKPFTGFHGIVCAISPNTTPTEYVNPTMALGLFGGQGKFLSALSPPQARSEIRAPCRSKLLGADARCTARWGPVGHVAEIQTADLVVRERNYLRLHRSC